MNHIFIWSISLFISTLKYTRALKQREEVVVEFDSTYLVKNEYEIMSFQPNASINAEPREKPT
jgi:hypothetical protein